MREVRPTSFARTARRAVRACLSLGALLFVATVHAQPCAPIPAGLVGWWRGENNGADSASTNAATLGGGTTFTNGVVGAAFVFDGIDDIAYVSDSVFASVTNNFTMEMWVFPTASNGVVNETISSGTGIGTGQRYAIFPAHGDNAFGGSGHAGAGISIGTNGITVFEHAAFYLPSPLVFTNALFGWNHVAVVYSNNQASLYLNGLFVRTGLASSRIVHPSGEMGGGAYGNFAGFMDEYGVYNRSLSSNEIANLFAAGSAGKCLLGAFAINRFTVDGGGGTSSDSLFSLRGTFGQPDAGALSGDNFTLRGGFWKTPFVAPPLLSITLSNGSVIISWPVSETNVVVQENSDLSTTNWMDVSVGPMTNGMMKKVMLPRGQTNKFFRPKK